MRQPQLSKKPDETALSNALTEALPPLAPELLGDVAEALGQLEEDRRQLEEYQSLARAVDRFEQRYRTYAGTQSRRQARALRQAQTDFDNASRARGEAHTRLELGPARGGARPAGIVMRPKRRSRGRGPVYEELRVDPTMQDADRLEARGEGRGCATATRANVAEGAVKEAVRRLARNSEEVVRAHERADRARTPVGQPARRLRCPG